MNTITRICNVLCMSVIFLSFLSMQGMAPDLFKFLDNNYSSDKLKCCLEGCADATKLNDAGFCLLHQLISANCYVHISHKDDFLKKGELLLHAIPGMVNSLTKRGETPVDVAYLGYKTADFMNQGTTRAFAKLIDLYKSYGGKTAKELREESHLS